jgi:hypothetical protein
MYGVAVLLTAKRTRRRAVTHSKVSPPTVVDTTVFISDPVRVYRTDPHRPPTTHARLAPPQAVSGAQVFGPVRILPARTRNPRLVQSDLRPPTVIDTPLFPPVDATVDVTLAPSRDVPRRLGKSKLSAPQAIAGAVVYPPPSTTLAPQPRQARAPKSDLRPPQVVTEVFYPRAPAFHLAPSSRLARRSHSRLTPPTVVAPSTYYLDVKLVPSPRLARGTHAEVRPPTVVFPFIPLALRVDLRVTGQEIGKRRPVHPRLRPPTVVTLPVDVIYIDYYDHPEPRGILSSSPREDVYGTDSGGITSSSPDTGAFDAPKPIGEMD